MDIRVLELSKYNPEVDIIIIDVPVGKMPPSRVNKYLENVKKCLKPVFEKRGFECLFIALREPLGTKISVAHEEKIQEVAVSFVSDSEKFDRAMEIVNKR